MLRQREPFDVTLYRPETLSQANLPTITSPETYNGLTNEYHPEGLFSEVLFPAKGREERDYKFGRIKLNTKILNPIVCKWFKNMGDLHEGIWQGKLYAIFDEKTKSFIKADPETGQTGYKFFLKHCKEVVFQRNKSMRRNNIINALEKYKDHYLIDHYLVLPAGLRDIQVDKSGKVTEDEVNEYYRKLIRLSNSIDHLAITDDSALDGIRASIQMTANTIFDYFRDIVGKGKQNFLLGNFAHRNIQDGTRNVISAMNLSVISLDDPTTPTVDTTQVGLYQALKGCRPLAIYHFREDPLYKAVFNQGEGQITVTDSKTWTKKIIPINEYVKDGWTTIEGIERIITSLNKKYFRFLPMRIEGNYFGLVYKDEEKYFFFQDITEIPEEYRNKDKITPITYYEYLYHVVKDKLYELPCQVTRYPVTGDESTYISWVYIRTTSPSKQLMNYYIDPLSGELTKGTLAKEYPINNDTSFSTVSPHPTRVKGMGGDYDGDKVTCNFLWLKDSINEAKRLLGSKASVFQADGSLKYDIETGITLRVVQSFIRDNTGVRSRRGT